MDQKVVAIQVLLSSGEEDEWEGEHLEAEIVDGYLTLRAGEQMLVMYAAGMWMKFEPVLSEDPPICGQVHGGGTDHYCALPYEHDGEHEFGARP